jgi:hypothetical protein
MMRSDLAAVGDQDLRTACAASLRRSWPRLRNCMRCGILASASRQIASTSASTLRVSLGSICAVVEHARAGRKPLHLTVERR